MLENVELAVLEYHNGRGDLVLWARDSLGNETLAEDCAKLKSLQRRKTAKEPHKGDRCCAVGGKMSEFSISGFRPKSYEQGSAREWLVANGLGGYASATTVGEQHSSLSRSSRGFTGAASRS